jgi:hypothetical protein
MRSLKLIVAAALLTGVAACKTDTADNGGVNSTPNDTTTPAPAGSADGSNGAASGAGDGSAGSPSVPTLVNVNQQNVLNNLSVSLQVDRNSIPVTAQVPIDVAAAVCGVSVDALAASIASGKGSCTATTTTPQLNQVVQQQISTGGDVNGGDQTLDTGGGA